MKKIVEKQMRELDNIIEVQVEQLIMNSDSIL